MKRLVILLILCATPAIAQEATGLVPLNITINNLYLQLGPELIMGTQELSIISTETIGKANISLVLEQTGSGIADLVQGIYTVGNISFATSEEAIVINSLNFSRVTNAAEWKNAEDSFSTISGYALQWQEQKIGYVYLDINFTDVEEEKVTEAALQLDDQNIGAISLDATNVDVPAELPIVLNILSGTVKDSNQNPIFPAIVKIVVGGVTFFVAVDEQGKYAVTIIAPPKAQATIYVNGIYVKTIITAEATSQQELDLILPPGGEANYPDQDKDGVADRYDNCPDSPTSNVNAYGCDCSQVVCPDSGCVSTTQGPGCLATCTDGYKNQNELGVDCGGVCRPCMTCDQPEKCLSAQPDYCTAEKKITPACQKCGCPTGYTCMPDGNCVQQINVEGRRCKINDWIYRMERFDCKSLGPTWYEEPTGQYYSVSVKGFIKKLRKKIKNKVESELRKATVCINTEDYGCVTPDVPCAGESVLKEYSSTIREIVQREVNSQIKKNVPGIARWFGTKVKVNVDLSPLKIRHEPYACPPVIVNPDRACKATVYNGPSSSKADILIVGDQFMSNEELDSGVRSLIDYASVQTNTPSEGLFSIEPFKSNKEKFNIWILAAQNQIAHKADPRKPSEGSKPVVSDVFKIASQCPQRDYIIVISKTPYRSFCYFQKPGPCLVSLPGRYPGRLLLHEFGHGFATLGDEYYTEINQEDYSGRIEDLTPLAGLLANCQPTQAAAQEAWGHLVTEGGKIGYYPTCGGDCGTACASFIRPTQNSIMNNQNCKESSPQPCPSGPPFDSYYAVNDNAILKALSAYT